MSRIINNSSYYIIKNNRDIKYKYVDFYTQDNNFIETFELPYDNYEETRSEDLDAMLDPNTKFNANISIVYVTYDVKRGVYANFKDKRGNIVNSLPFHNFHFYKKGNDTIIVYKNYENDQTKDWIICENYSDEALLKYILNILIKDNINIIFNKNKLTTDNVKIIINYNMVFKDLFTPWTCIIC